MQPKAGVSVRPGTRIYYGWWVLLALSSMIFLNAGAYYYAFTAFFNPIKDSLSLSATAVSVAFALRTLEGGLASPVVGFFVDRVGPRKMIFVGSLVTGFGMIWLSRVNSLPTFYAAFMMTAVGTSLATGMVGMATTCNWFVRKRGLALGLYFAGGGLGGFLVPVVVWLIGGYGWRQALVVIGVAFWVVGTFTALIARRRPEDMGLLPDGDTPAASSASGKNSRVAEVNFGVWQAMRTRTFWLLSVAFMAATMAPQAVAALQIPYLESIDLTPQIAGLAVSAMTVVSTVGRLGFGWLGDHVDKRYALAAAMVMQTLGMVVLAAVLAPWMLVPYLLFYSPAFGGMIPLRPAILADYYGRKAIGAVQGALWSIVTLGCILSPIFAAWVFDNVGSYRPAFYALAAVTAMGIPLVLLAKRPVIAADR